MWNKFPSEDPQSLGTTARILLASAKWTPEFAYERVKRWGGQYSDILILPPEG
jgi:hypothetical protein